LLRGAATSPAGLILVLVLAFLVRILGILQRPIWYDEAFAILFARTGPAAMLVGTLTPTGAGTADIHPLGYYALLWMWMRYFGESLASVRSLSILAGIGTVIVGYALARRLFGQITAIVSALVLALAPFQVHYSQEIRMYAFLGFWLTVATYCFLRATTSTSWGWWLAFSASAAGAQYTHNLAATYLLPLALWPLLRRQWRNLRRAGLAGLIAVLLYTPWLLNLPAQFAKVSQGYWIQRPSIERLLMLPVAFVSNLPVPPALLGPALFASLGVAAFGLAHTIRGYEEIPGQRHAASWMLYMSFAPPLLLFLISQRTPVYLERTLIASGVMFCIWLGCQIASESLPSTARGILVCLASLGFAIGLWQHLNYQGFPYAPYQLLDADIRTRQRAGDVIVHSSKLSFLPSLYFDRSLPATYVADTPGSTTDTLAPSTQMILGIRAAPTTADAVGTAPRVWFVIFEESNQEYVMAGYPRHPQLTELLEKYRVAETIKWDDLTVYLLVADSAP
jgi:hypothetical protein